MRTRLFAIAAVVLVLANTGSAFAGWGNELGRNLGLGWSDGYHAYEGCPDPRHRAQPWQRRSKRSGGIEEPFVPYLQPTPAVRPAPPSSLPEPTTRAAMPTRSSQLRISRPIY